MQTLEALKTSIAATEQMLGIVKTMKTLAAINIREYERAVEALRQYSSTIALGLQVALRDLNPITDTDPLGGQPLGVIVFGSEQGLAGQFNERVANFARAWIESHDDDWQNRRIMAIGQRVAGHLVDNGLHVTEEIGVPNSIERIRTACQDVLFAIDRWRTDHHLERIILFHNTPMSSSTYESRSRWLLPINPGWLRSVQHRQWRSRSLPTHALPADMLFARLIHQLLFVILYRAFAESLASENASRLRSMQSAESNINDRLERLKADYLHRRQSAITEELLDIAAGFEALSIGTD